MPRDRKKDAPYDPAYKGFDAERTRHAQETAERAQQGASAPGSDANREYVDEGPQEAAARRGESVEETGSSIERAAKRAKRP